MFTLPGIGAPVLAAAKAADALAAASRTAVAGKSTKASASFTARPPGAPSHPRCSTNRRGGCRRCRCDRHRLSPDDAALRAIIASSHDSRRAHPARRLTRAEAVLIPRLTLLQEELLMTEISNPIVQAVHDAIEAAIAATATELSQAVGLPMSDRAVCGRWATWCVGPATADQIRDRVEQLKNTIRQYLHWTSAAIPVMNAA